MSHDFDGVEDAAQFRRTPRLKWLVVLEFAASVTAFWVRCFAHCDALFGVAQLQSHLLPGSCLHALPDEGDSFLWGREPGAKSQRTRPVQLL